MQRAAAFYDRGDFHNAIVCYRKFLKEVPDAVEVWHMLAGLCFQQARYDESIAALQAAIRLKPQEPRLESDLGGIYLQLGRLQEAEAHLQRTLALAPAHVEAQYNLSLVFVAQSRHVDAIRCLQSITVTHPEFAAAHFNLGIALKSQGQLAAAISALEKYRSLEPADPRVILELARALRAHHAIIPALEHYRRYREIAAQDIAAIGEYADLLAESGDVAAAVALLQDQLAKTPTDRRLRGLLAQILQNDGQLATAESLYLTLLLEDASSIEAAIGLSRSRTIRHREEPIMTALTTALEGVEDDTDAAAALHFALGKGYDDLLEFDVAFAHYHRGNQICRRRRDYRPADSEDLVQRIIEVFTQPFIAELRAHGSPSATPVFIVGMPRSGTTLVEQVFASHPLATGAGELGFFLSLAVYLPAMLQSTSKYPECCKLLDQNTAHQITAQYSGLLHRYSASALRISNKMPANFFYLGLIKALFPYARVVHCQRDPGDVCLSIYFQYFQEQHAYAWDLDDIAHYYSQYQRLMAHWQQVLPGEILSVQYEQVVGDLETASRGLLDFCGLEWDPRCLEFHHTRREVKTASYSQVRQPLYQSSLQRWRRYAHHLPESVLRLRN